MATGGTATEMKDVSYAATSLVPGPTADAKIRGRSSHSQCSHSFASEDSTDHRL